MVKGQVSMDFQDAYTRLEEFIVNIGRVTDDLLSDVRDLQQRTHSMNTKIKELESNQKIDVTKLSREQLETIANVVLNKEEFTKLIKEVIEDITNKKKNFLVGLEEVK
jgi:vacuolar-type H+-ATPase subunit I/STV1